jgi:hypothetical protein
MTGQQVKARLRELEAKLVTTNGPCSQYESGSGHLVTVCADGRGGFTLNEPPGCSGCSPKRR